MTRLLSSVSIFAPTDKPQLYLQQQLLLPIVGPLRPDPSRRTALRVIAPSYYWSINDATDRRDPAT